MRRMLLALRGPGAILAVFAAATAGTAVSRHGAHANRVTHVSPAQHYSLRVGANHPTVDRATGLRAALRSASIANVTSHRLVLHLHVRLATSHRPSPLFNLQDIFLVDRSGRTYGSGPPGAAFPIPASGGAFIPISVQVPDSIRWLEVEWNDGGRLIPPATLATIELRWRTSIR